MTFPACANLISLFYNAHAETLNDDQRFRCGFEIQAVRFTSARIRILAIFFITFAYGATSTSALLSLISSFN
jgi:hypothetical protein